MTTSRTIARARRTALAAVLASGAALAASAAPAAAQAAAATAAAAAPATVLAVGDLAPDFALPGATRYGRLMGPVRLADLKGQTIVIAFFYRARSKG